MSETKKPSDGGPAFPQDLQGRRGDDPSLQGMSLRAYFAGQALAGLMANPNIQPGGAAKDYAEVARLLADALIAELEKQG